MYDYTQPCSHTGLVGDSDADCIFGKVGCGFVGFGADAVTAGYGGYIIGEGFLGNGATTCGFGINGYEVNFAGHVNSL